MESLQGHAASAESDHREAISTQSVSTPHYTCNVHPRARELHRCGKDVDEPKLASVGRFHLYFRRHLTPRKNCTLIHWHLSQTGSACASCCCLSCQAQPLGTSVLFSASKTMAPKRFGYWQPGNCGRPSTPPPQPKWGAVEMERPIWVEDKDKRDKYRWENGRRPENGLSGPLAGSDRKSRRRRNAWLWNRGTTRPLARPHPHHAVHRWTTCCGV